MSAKDDLMTFVQRYGYRESFSDLVNRLMAEVREDALMEAAELVDAEAWPHERPDRENKEFYRIADMIRSLADACAPLKGDGEDSDGEKGHRQ